MKRNLIMALLIALLCVSVSACGGQSSDATTTTGLPPSTSTTVQAQAFPGVYTAAVTVEELESTGANDMTLAGDWVFTFTTAGDSTVDYVASQTGARAWGGAMVVDGDRMTISTEGVGKDCQGEGSYTWTFDGTQLSFQLVSDNCPTRQAVLAGHPWARQP
jgi:hypothetical protein